MNKFVVEFGRIPFLNFNDNLNLWMFVNLRNDSKLLIVFHNVSAFSGNEAETQRSRSIDRKNQSLLSYNDNLTISFNFNTRLSHFPRPLRGVINFWLSASRRARASREEPRADNLTERLRNPRGRATDVVTVKSQADDRNYDFPLDAREYRNVTGDNLRLRIHARGRASYARRAQWKCTSSIRPYGVYLTSNVKCWNWYFVEWIRYRPVSRLKTNIVERQLIKWQPWFLKFIPLRRCGNKIRIVIKNNVITKNFQDRYYSFYYINTFILKIRLGMDTFKLVLL